MSEIEKAIKFFEALVEKRTGYLNNCKSSDKRIQRERLWIETGATALKALQEQAEREKGCAFCTTGAHRILQNALYCPRCGKRLEVGHEAD